MEATNYARLTAAVFAVIGLLQLARAAMGLEITLNGMTIPIWPSWITGVVGIDAATLEHARRLR